MDAATQANEKTGARGLWKRRLIVVLGAVLAAVVVYLIASAVTGGLKTPAMGSQASASLNVGFVIFVSGFTSLVGWGLLALLEKITAKGGLIWTVVASVVLLLSLGGPMSGTGITTGNRVSLALMHLAVGAVLIPFLPRGKRA
jgi:hypothetical protein